MSRLFAVLAAGCLLLGPRAVQAQTVEYYHLDAQGNVLVVTDSGGTVVEQHDYLPYGEECVTGPCAGNTPVGQGDQPKRFTGKERDAETGLDYFGARYYGSKIGRFTTTDPAYTIAENLVDPQRWNRYAYARNNPLRYVDPDGRVLILSGSQTAQTQATAIANSGLFGQQLIIAANGVASLQGTGQQGPPTAGQAALAGTLAGVIADKGVTRISLSEGSPTTITGSWAKSDIDVSDMAMFGRGPGPTMAGKLGHEVTEQYLKQVKGIGDFGVAHSQAVAAENRITGWVRSTTDTGQLDRSGSGFIVQTATRDGVTLRTGLQLSTGNITGITRKQE